MIDRLRNDEGMTLVELSIVSLLLGFVLALVGTAMLMMSRTERSTSADTESLTALRIARENIEKEVREADQILDTSTTDSLQLWLDTNNDDAVDSGETVTWSFETAPGGGAYLVRTVPDTGERWVAAEELVTPAGNYDAFTDGGVAPDSSTSLLTVTLRTQSQPGAGEIETISTSIYLRNKR